MPLRASGLALGSVLGLWIDVVIGAAGANAATVSTMQIEIVRDVDIRWRGRAARPGARLPDVEAGGGGFFEPYDVWDYNPDEDLIHHSGGDGWSYRDRIQNDTERTVRFGVRATFTVRKTWTVAPGRELVDYSHVSIAPDLFTSVTGCTFDPATWWESRDEETCSQGKSRMRLRPVRRSAHFVAHGVWVEAPVLVADGSQTTHVRFSADVALAPGESFFIDQTPYESLAWWVDADFYDRPLGTIHGTIHHRPPTSDAGIVIPTPLPATLSLMLGALAAIAVVRRTTLRQRPGTTIDAITPHE